MIASVSINMTPSQPDTASLSAKSEVPTIQTPSIPVSDKASAVPAPATSTQTSTASMDTVDISTTAIDMSKNINQQAEKKSEITREAVKDAQQKNAEKEQNAYLAAGKNFPPFMGNKDELSAIKSSSPSLYREILRMIMPPPLDLSPTDLQMLKGAGYTDGNGKNSNTTA